MIMFLKIGINMVFCPPNELVLYNVIKENWHFQSPQFAIKISNTIQDFKIFLEIEH